MMHARQLPHSDSAERSALGAVMVDNDLISPLRTLLTPDDFYSDRHRKVFAAVEALVDKGSVVDLVTLKDELVNRGQLDEVGGVAYLAEMMVGVPRSANVEHYARIVRGKASRRGLMKLGSSLYESASNGASDSELVDLAEAAVDASPRFNGMPDLPDCSTVEPIRWGWAIDRLLPAPGLTLVYGGEGCGKSTLGAHIALALLGGETRVLGRGVNERHNAESVLWVACEDPPGFVRGHYLERVARGLGYVEDDGVKIPKGLTVVYTGDRQTWGRKLGMRDVPMLIERYAPDLIVLDYWNGLCRMPEGQEFSTQGWFDVLQDLRDALWQRFRIPALLFHHYNARGEMAGNRQLKNSCDQVWHLEKCDSGMLKMGLDKSRGDADQTLYLVREASDAAVVIRTADQDERRKAAIQPWEPRIIAHLLDQPSRQAAQSDLGRAGKLNRRTLGDTLATAEYIEATGEKSRSQSPIWRLTNTPNWYEET